MIHKWGADGKEKTQTNQSLLMFRDVRMREDRRERKETKGNVGHVWT